MVYHWCHTSTVVDWNHRSVPLCNAGRFKFCIYVCSLWNDVVVICCYSSLTQPLVIFSTFCLPWCVHLQFFADQILFCTVKSSILSTLPPPPFLRYYTVSDQHPSLVRIHLAPRVKVHYLLNFLIRAKFVQFFFASIYICSQIIKWFNNFPSRVIQSRKYSMSKLQSTKTLIMELTVSEYNRLALILICLHFYNSFRL